MKNIIKILSPIISENRIEYNYEITGDWQEAYNLDEKFYIEYSYNVSKTPNSIAVIPLLCNILPIAWVYDAEIYLESCDKAFYESIPEFKKGYINMYPNINFGGKIHVNSLDDNKNSCDNGAVSFFSGGVDAFNTLVNHIEEKPVLLTIWGADVKFEDVNGWKNVTAHLQNTASEFNINYVTIKSCFRCFIKESVLSLKVGELSGDNWWHGFQHGIGIIGHAAPICSVMNKAVAYFASSFTIAEKGKVTCASDPTIDNYVKFGGTHVVHDGYEFNRQDKVHNIVKYSRKTGLNIPLRVCWQSTGGKNCCECEKCWRTILEIIAEGADAKEYDFGYTQLQLKEFYKLYHDKKNIPDYRRDSIYLETQQLMKANLKYENLPKELQWFYKIDIKKLGHHPYRRFFKKCFRKGKSVIRKVIK